MKWPLTVLRGPPGGAEAAKLSVAQPSQGLVCPLGLRPFCPPSSPTCCLTLGRAVVLRLRSQQGGKT